MLDFQYVPYKDAYGTLYVDACMRFCEACTDENVEEIARWDAITKTMRAAWPELHRVVMEKKI